MFFPISPKCAKIRAFFRYEVAFLRLLAPFYAFLRTFAAVSGPKLSEPNRLTLTLNTERSNIYYQVLPMFLVIFFQGKYLVLNCSRKNLSDIVY